MAYTLFNKNLFSAFKGLAASGSETAYETFSVNVNGPVLVGLWAAGGAQGTVTFGFRLRGVNGLIVPKAGYEWIRMPGAVSYWADLDTPLSGPPYAVEVDAWQGGASTFGFSIVLAVADIKEKDLDFQILNELRSMNERFRRVYG